MTLRLPLPAAAAVLLLLGGVAAAMLPRKGESIVVSLGPTGEPVTFEGPAGVAASENGRAVLLISLADLVLQDTNGVADIYVRDVRRQSTFLGSAQADGTSGNDATFDGVLSGNGRYLAFRSRAEDLVDDDDNEREDIFVRDLVRGTVERVSVGPNGEQSDGNSSSPSISRNGRFVAFMTLATNFHPGDGNDTWDIFVRDRKKGTTTLASVATTENAGDSNSEDPHISGNGKVVTFASNATDLVTGVGGNRHIFARDLRKGTTEHVSRATDGAIADGFSESGPLSHNGRYITFSSEGTNLIPDDGNGISDVFLRDRKRGSTVRVSRGVDGQELEGFSYGPQISSNGRFVAFSAFGTEFEPGGGAQAKNVLALFDRKKGIIAVLVGLLTESAPQAIALAKKGQLVVYNDDIGDQVVMLRR